ncbi:hypothetical protein Pelo_16521 [Pelomyxa schiedti]|nr:hypothetical protein Pelo_16521 [Pelomyxa schiedti]
MDSTSNGKLGLTDDEGNNRQYPRDDQLQFIHSFIHLLEGSIERMPLMKDIPYYVLLSRVKENQPVGNKCKNGRKSSVTMRDWEIWQLLKELLEGRGQNGRMKKHLQRILLAECSGPGYDESHEAICRIPETLAREIGLSTLIHHRFVVISIRLGRSDWESGMFGYTIKKAAEQNAGLLKNLLEEVRMEG